MPNRIEISTAAEHKIAPFLALTATHYHDEPINDPAVVRWRHLDNDAGPSQAVELLDGDECVGRMWIQIRPWSVNGTAIRAANPIDFLIREDHRKLPAFMSLFKSTMAECNREADIVFHTSNPSTDDLYRRLMKLEPVTELDGALLPIRPFALAQAAKRLRTGGLGRLADAAVSGIVRIAGLAARLGGIRIERNAPSRIEQDALIRSFEHEERVCASRDFDHRDWRFRGAGPIRYSQRWLWRKGRLVGYVVSTDRDLDGLNGQFIVDLVFPGSPSRIARWSMWLQLAADATSRGRHAVFFFYNRSNPRLARLASLPLITAGRERLPQRVPVFVRPSPTLQGMQDVGWNGGYYVLSDFDMF
jgi:hypothetical protein